MQRQWKCDQKISSLPLPELFEILHKLNLANMSLSQINLPPTYKQALVASATERCEFLRVNLAAAIEQDDFSDGVRFYLRELRNFFLEKVMPFYVFLYDSF